MTGFNSSLILHSMERKKEFELEFEPYESNDPYKSN